VIACARKLLSLLASLERIFEWADGSLVEAMRAGGAFLADEISLAEDSVLERLNSVLETDHFLLLAEKPATGRQLEEVRAGPTFRLFATMNPGGDFGKRELSPALRNRFTERGGAHRGVSVSFHRSPSPFPIPFETPTKFPPQLGAT
ncbi:unnamed protein product, partial [Prorocentrum cordatum]